MGALLVILFTVVYVLAMAEIIFSRDISCLQYLVAGTSVLTFMAWYPVVTEYIYNLF